MEQIKAEGYDIITPVVICNSDDFTIRLSDGMTATPFPKISSLNVGSLTSLMLTSLPL